MVKLNLQMYSGVDPREIPTYTTADASRYIRVPLPTIKSWVRGRPYPVKTGQKFFDPIISLPSSDSPLLSFINLVEIHMLAAIRRQYQIDVPKVRKAISVLTERFQSKHPLADHEFETDGIDLFVEKLGHKINISSEQLPLEEVLRAYLRRIDRDQGNRPLRLYPFTGPFQRFTDRTALGQPMSVVIDPFVSFGRPVIASTGIRTDILAGRWRAGDKIPLLARDYHLDEEKIEEAIRYELAA